MRKEIKKATTDLIKMDKINHYKALIKRRRKNALSKLKPGKSPTPLQGGS